MYAAEVLPRVLAEVGACRDEIAQGYLLDSLIQVRGGGTCVRDAEEVLLIAV